ncbi:hypothetical protein DPMN_047752 [Dreissena polymorpha]|uniref:Uncharacterized protein n=1 Tax=Dreissena polymorpha TaxID=45954 RepID=A0A9D4DAB2_DREPO|nr:hypothetical protein DPMN_047752 [Dreissena polymorpha]
MTLESFHDIMVHPDTGADVLAKKHTATRLFRSGSFSILLRSGFNKLFAFFEKKLRMSKVRLDGWVVVEMSSDVVRIQSNKSRLWIDLPDDPNEL